jgi:hypothetical protein
MIVRAGDKFIFNETALSVRIGSLVKGLVLHARAA